MQFCILNVYTTMEATIKKWGNSLGIRIPKSFSAQAKISDGSKIEINMEGNKITIVPIQKKTYELDELLSMVSEENVHYEIESDGPIGNEVW
jgi:antitoxin MazE